MNKIILVCFMLFALLGAVFACPDDYVDNEVTIGKCAADVKAQYRKPTAGEVQVLSPSDLSPSELQIHETNMQYILNVSIAVNRKFVASIYFPNGTLACYGVNYGKPNLINHGEIAAINNCTAMYGITTFTNYTLYTTGEPCSMCASAILWSKFSTIVWGTYNKDLYCKICMSNIPADSIDTFSKYYGISTGPMPKVIGGVLKEQTDAWFGSYCNRTTSIFYIAPQCACSDVVITVSQTQGAQWTDNSGVLNTLFNGEIKNIGSTTITNPLFVTSPAGIVLTQIWGLEPVANTPDTYSLSHYSGINPNAVIQFNYIIQGSQTVTFKHKP